MALTDYLDFSDVRHPLTTPRFDRLPWSTSWRCPSTETVCATGWQSLLTPQPELDRHQGRLWMHSESGLLWSSVTDSWVGIAREWRDASTEERLRITARTMIRTLTMLGCLPDGRRSAAET